MMKTNRRTTRRAARRLFRLCLVDGMLDEARVRQVASRLAGSGRRGSLPILGDFARLVRLDRERSTAVIESAIPLPPDVRDGLNAGLARAFGPGGRARFVLNPALIAGLRIKVGSHLYDGSVRARLAALQARL
jgi:F-type H+-transporting ATPase subunit delta